MINTYLDALFLDTSHPSPWTNLVTREVVADKKYASVKGFKLMYSTLRRHRTLHQWIDTQKDVTVISLTRANLLKSFISAQRLRHTKMAHTTETSISYRPVVVKTAHLLSYFNSVTAEQLFFREKYSTSHPYLELSYEELFANQATTMEEILEHFSLAPEPMPLPRMERTGSDVLETEVANYQEVIDVLTGTAYEPFLLDFKRPAPRAAAKPLEKAHRR